MLYNLEKKDFILQPKVAHFEMFATAHSAAKFFFFTAFCGTAWPLRSVHFWLSPIPMILGMKRVVLFNFLENWKLNSALKLNFNFQFCWLDLTIIPFISVG